MMNKIMKKMYKKPITDTVSVKTDEMMNPALNMSGVTDSLEAPNPMGDAPLRAF